MHRHNETGWAINLEVNPFCKCLKYIGTDKRSNKSCNLWKIKRGIIKIFLENLMKCVQFVLDFFFVFFFTVYYALTYEDSYSMTVSTHLSWITSAWYTATVFVKFTMFWVISVPCTTEAKIIFNAKVNKPMSCAKVATTANGYSGEVLASVWQSSFPGCRGVLKTSNVWIGCKASNGM